MKTEISNFRTKFHTGKPPRYIKCYHRKEASSLWQQPQSNYFPNVIREHTCFFTSKVVSKLPTGRYFVTRIIINHELLIAKMYAYGFSIDALKIVHSYLSDRWHRTKIDGSFSTWKKILAGMPQGSVNGPKWFNIYPNDLFSCFWILKYAILRTIRLLMRVTQILVFFFITWKVTQPLHCFGLMLITWNQISPSVNF